MRYGCTWGSILLLSVAGCASSPSAALANRDLAEVAVLSIRGGVITGVNGKRFTALQPLAIKGFRLLPGEHTLILDCRHELLTRPTEFRGYFEAGHAYQLTCHYQGDRRFAADMKDLGKSDDLVR
jgi:hypothetical protein